MRFLLAFLATFLAAALAPTGAAAARSPIHVRRVETADLRGSVESLADMVRKVRAGLPSSLQGGKNGAAPCAACTVVLGIVEQMTLIYESTVEQELEKLCSILPTKILEESCDEVVKIFGPNIIAGLDAKLGPDKVCGDLRLCTGDCKLFKKPISSAVFGTRPAVYPFTPAMIDAKLAALGWNPFQWLIDLINKFANQHEPLVDLDGDFFSPDPGFRGAHWRGRDCVDDDKTIYPGRKTSTHGASVDHDCNGVSGINAQGQSYEDVLCAGTPRQGTIVVGDSVGAHFEIPPQWLNASTVSRDALSDVVSRAEDEFDLPYRGFTTGYVQSSQEVPVNSLYEYTLAANRCNFRDFQNMGVNGERSGSATKLVNSIGRKVDTDHPALVVFELVGNDICHPAHSLDSITSPEEFKKNLLESLAEFDTYLPAGSHMLFLNLADGRILYNALKDATHPIGVPYPDFYDYLNCLELSPCWAWMNSNETVRNGAAAKMDVLNQVSADIVAQASYKNFDMHLIDFATMMQEVSTQGIPMRDLIEPVDGFHPNQRANSLIGQYLFANLTATAPHFLAPTNPNNANITALFGDQGGY